MTARTSAKKSGKKFKVVFVPVKTIHCENRFTVSNMGVGGSGDTHVSMCVCMGVWGGGGGGGGSRIL